MNITYYEELGYSIPKVKNAQGKYTIRKGTKILVSVDDLQQGSNVKVTKICDDCGAKTLNQKYVQILSRRRLTDGVDRCDTCGHKHARNTIKNNVPYKKSLEWFALSNNKQFLLTEFSDKNLISPRDVYSNTSNKYYWNCSDCGGCYENSTNRRSSGVGCPYCSGRKALKGFNDLWTTNPDIASILSNKDQGYNLTRGSHKEIEFICSDCGIKQNHIVKNVVASGFSCKRCSDGISYPEKFVAELLSQLNISYVTQYRLKNKFYDFHLPSLNLIIETHGLQHYEEGFKNFNSRSLKDEIENDAFKKQMALCSGIVNYEVIDCRKSSMSWITDSISNSNLPKLLKFNNDDIDWKKCHEFACKSLVKKVSHLWQNLSLSITDISSLVNLSKSTIIIYLKRGAELGWCDYEPRIMIKNNGRKRGKGSKKKIVQLSLNNDFIKVWDSLTEASTTLGCSISSLSQALKGEIKSAFKYKWYFLNDYNKYKSSGEKLKPYERKTNNKPIVQLDLQYKFIRYFTSISHASSDTGISLSNIASVCRGERKSAGGFKWVEVKDYEELLKKEDHHAG